MDVYTYESADVCLPVHVALQAFLEVLSFS